MRQIWDRNSVPVRATTSSQVIFISQIEPAYKIKRSSLTLYTLGPESAGLSGPFDASHDACEP